MAARRLPAKMRAIIVKKLGTNFRDVTEIVEQQMPTPGPNEIIVKNRFVGINASDINYTAGRYDPRMKPPFPSGFEGIGEVVNVGSGTKTKVGQAVVYSKGGAFCDYIAVDETTAVPVPTVDPAFLSLLVSGLTASISLEKEGDLRKDKKVLITAAAGGTGQYAVQLAKLAGCHVIGTCSTEEKEKFLKDIGCDRVIIYSKESLDDVLAKEYPSGVDVVYETVGNEVFDAALKNLAVYGRLIVIGMISNYEAGSDNNTFEGLQEKRTVPIPMTCLKKSASVRGFFLPHYRADYGHHIAMLAKYIMEGKLKISTDKGSNAPTGPFIGLEKVADAIEYMYSRKSLGKVVVELGRDDKSAL